MRKAFLLILFITVLPAIFPVSGSTAAFAAPGREAGIGLSSESLPDFREVYNGHFSDVQFYDVWAEGLSHDLVISSENGFRISLHCYEDFSEQIILSPHQGEISLTRIFVRFFAGQPGVHEESIAHQAGESVNAALAVKATSTLSQVPAAYYASAEGNGQRLKTSLHHIIRNHQTQSYGSLWTHFQTTDASFSGYVWDIYSDTPCTEPPYLYVFGEDQDTGSGGNAENQFYNREHSMPLSWFGGAIPPMNSDLYHIYPVDKFVNAQRANFPFGEVNNPFWLSMNGGRLGGNSLPGYSGTAFEPIDDYKGDLARAFLYMITRYEDIVSQWDYSPEGNQMLSQNTWPGFRPWAMEMLIRWHEEDPVSQKEIRRNDRVYQIQGNRNPFIDHPEFVERIWGDTTLHSGHIPATGLFRVYPNPAKSHIKIETPEGITGIKLLNMLGEPVIQKHRSRITLSMPEAIWWQLDLQGISPGLYLLVIETPGQRHTEKILIEGLSGIN